MYSRTPCYKGKPAYCSLGLHHLYNSHTEESRLLITTSFLNPWHMMLFMNFTIRICEDKWDQHILSIPGKSWGNNTKDLVTGGATQDLQSQDQVQLDLWLMSGTLRACRHVKLYKTLVSHAGKNETTSQMGHVQHFLSKFTEWHTLKYKVRI